MQELLNRIRPVTDDDKNLPVFSYSKMEVFKNCPLQYKYKYIEKKFTKIPGVGRMQLMLIDSDGCEVKTPEFSFEIRRTINESLDDVPITYQAYTTEDGKILLSEDGKIIVN